MMRILGLLVIVIALLLGAFAALNWTAFTTPAALSLVVTGIEAPLGVIMLGVAFVFAALGFGFAGSVRVQMLLESRRLARELQAQRDLAERAETSRLTDLRTELDRRLSELAASIQSTPNTVIQRIDALDRSLRDAIAAAMSPLASSIGEEGRAERERSTPGGHH